MLNYQRLDYGNISKCISWFVPVLPLVIYYNLQYVIPKYYSALINHYSDLGGYNMLYCNPEKIMKIIVHHAPSPFPTSDFAYSKTIIPLIRWLVPISAHTATLKRKYAVPVIKWIIFIYICVCNIAIVIGVILYANLWRFIAMLIPMCNLNCAPTVGLFWGIQETYGGAHVAWHRLVGSFTSVIGQVGLTWVNRLTLLRKPGWGSKISNDFIGEWRWFSQIVWFFCDFFWFLFPELGEGTSHVGCGSPFRLMNPPSI